MRVVIEIIPHENQRYSTVGDWWWTDTTLHIRVSSLNDWRKEMAIAYHELFEALACVAAGISEKVVDDFDMTWLPHDGIEEPGNDPQAPYFTEHQLALVPEWLLAMKLGLNWQEYEDSIKSLTP